MHRRWVMIGAMLGMTAVAGGAFGAHALKDRLDAESLANFQVGVRYQMYHALALIGVAWVASLGPSRAANAAGVCMFCGVLCFSGSLYGLVLLQWRWLGPVTPLGGALLITGWLLLAVATAKVSPRRPDEA